MSVAGRGRGDTGRHQQREPRPGDDQERTLADLTQTSPDSLKEARKPEMKPPEVDSDRADMYHINPEDDAVLQELLTIDQRYKNLLDLLEQFSPGEDGIHFNRKLKQFESTVNMMCPDETRLQQAFATFRAAALLSSKTARKLAAVGASFTRQQRQQLLRGALLNVVMQGTFAKLDVLERANPLFLVNAANLMGDYFAEARLCNGNKVHIIAGPLLRYMKALVASADIKAHRSLATQLMQNGRELLTVLGQELDELSISIRLRLLSAEPMSILWLLLSADLCLNKFLPLPNSLQQFYAEHLDLTVESNFNEVSYGSWKKSPEKDAASEASLDVSTEKVSHNLSQISINEELDTKPKLRPILGAGAGLLRQEQTSVTQDSFETWTKGNLSKRYDLNSWRQGTDDNEETVYNPAVLPPTLAIQNPATIPANVGNLPPSVANLPNITNLPANSSEIATTTPPIQKLPPNFTVPNFPPPNINNFNYQKDNFHNYLQQGDSTYIQSQFQANSNFNSQGDSFVQYTTETPNQPEKVNNEVQKSRADRKPVENWRKEKIDPKDEANKNKPRNWSRQQSRDNVSESNDDEKEKNKEDGLRSASRSSRDGKTGKNRRNSAENDGKTLPQRRHVSDVPRSQKYWDHDDRCDKDYNEVN